MTIPFSLLTVENLAEKFDKFLVINVFYSKVVVPRDPIAKQLKCDDSGYPSGLFANSFPYLASKYKKQKISRLKRFQKLILQKIEPFA